jgi:hypothetical protein
MGANAVTTVPVYTAGEVLTAADMNITNSGIPVFATTVTRDAAFGGTGEKTLAEGQFAYIEATNTTQYYDGAAWQSVGVTPGLVFITGATFSAVTSVSLPTSTFSATYTNYLVQFYATTATAQADITARFRAAGADNTTSNYSYASNGVYSNGNDANLSGNAVSSFAMRGIYTNLPFSATLTISEPQTANEATVTGMVNANGNTTTALTASLAFAGLFNDSTSFDSFSFLASAAITGNYKVYGYSNS